MDEYYMPQDCPPNTTLYAVKPGDTYYSIARRFGTTIEALTSANPGVDPNSLRVAQLLCVPRRSAYPPCPGGTYYTVRPGDTLYAIALQFSITLNALAAANPGVDPNKLYVGQSLCVPVAAAPGGCAAGATPYIVRPGDTLYAIAVSHSVGLGALMSANPGVNPRALAVGQVLCVPLA